MWSYLLAAVGVAGIFLAGRTRAWIGWTVGLSAQLLWIVYALVTRQYGFLVSAAAYGTVYGLNLRRALFTPLLVGRPHEGEEQAGGHQLVGEHGPGHSLPSDRG